MCALTDDPGALIQLVELTNAMRHIQRELANGWFYFTCMVAWKIDA